VKRAPGTCAEPGCADAPVYRGRCSTHVQWNTSPRQRGRALMARRNRIARTRGRRCHRCGAPPTPGHPLELHHIDGNPTNDHLANLELLCDDCHLAAKLH
jgi:5-methylcytosine-specific restriction endonuclease McrA